MMNSEKCIYYQTDYHVIQDEIMTDDGNTTYQVGTICTLTTYIFQLRTCEEIIWDVFVRKINEMPRH